MANKEYEQKKRECWEEIAAEVAVETGNLLCKAIAYTIFDRAYALGKLEKDAEDTVISGWVARDSNSDLFIYNDKPKRDTRWDGVGIWYGEYITELASNHFPDLTWDSEPLEVELIIKRKKK